MEAIRRRKGEEVSRMIDTRENSDRERERGRRSNSLRETKKREGGGKKKEKEAEGQVQIRGMTVAAMTSTRFHHALYIVRRS